MGSSRFLYSTTHYYLHELSLEYELFKYFGLGYYETTHREKSEVKSSRLPIDLVVLAMQVSLGTYNGTYKKALKRQSA